MQTGYARYSIKIANAINPKWRAWPGLLFVWATLAEPLSFRDKPLLLSTEELEKSIEYLLVSIEPLLLSGKGKLLSNKAMLLSAEH